MPRLLWDDISDRRYELGVSNAAVYFLNGDAQVWNGVVGIGESEIAPPSSAYLEGVQYYVDRTAPPTQEVLVSAYTYPDQISHVSSWAGMTYQTRTAGGYQIHILYNVTADLDPFGYFTNSELVNPSTFTWKLSCRPENFEGHRPSAHVIFDSELVGASVMTAVRDILYGTAAQPPKLLGPDEIMAVSGAKIVITDHGDGVWSAYTLGNFIEMTSSTEFKITEVDATYLDADTYTITTTFN